MAYNRNLWESAGEAEAFRLLVFWNGENKDRHFYANRASYPHGWFDADQAFIKTRWHLKKSRTMTSIRRYLHKWASLGMMQERWWNGVLIYRWLD